MFLVLRAFASGCTALTGVEAISNGVPAFKVPKSRNAAGTLVDHGRAGDDDVRGHHAARAAQPRPHGRVDRGPDRRAGGLRAAHRAQPDRAREFRGRTAVLPAAGVHGGDPRARGEHRVQRLPGADLAAGPRWLHAPPAQPPRRPAGVLERDRRARGDRVAADRRLRRAGDAPDPALHPRRVPLLHAEPAGDGPPLEPGDARARTQRRAAAQAGGQRDGRGASRASCW